MTTTLGENKQTGSIVSFVLIGVVLVALFASGLYFAKQRGMIAAHQGATSDSAQQSENTQSDTATQGDSQTKEETKKPANEQQNTSGSGGGTSTNPPATNQPQTPQGTSGSAPGQAQPSQQAPVVVAPRTGGQSSETIPATGFEDQVMVSTLGMTALVYGGVRYVQSRRRLSRF